MAAITNTVAGSRSAGFEDTYKSPDEDFSREFISSAGTTHEVYEKHAAGLDRSDTISLEDETLTAEPITQRQFFEICEINDKHEKNLELAYDEYNKKLEIQESEEGSDQSQPRTTTAISECDSIEPFMFEDHYPEFSKVEFSRIIRIYNESSDVTVAYAKYIKSLEQDEENPGTCSTGGSIDERSYEPESQATSYKASLCHGYALRNYCKHGSNCNYDHKVVKEIEKFCEGYFIEGICPNGEKCSKEFHYRSFSVPQEMISELNETEKKLLRIAKYGR